MIFYEERLRANIDANFPARRSRPRTRKRQKFPGAHFGTSGGLNSNRAMSRFRGARFNRISNGASIRVQMSRKRTPRIHVPANAFSLNGGRCRCTLIINCLAKWMAGVTLAGGSMARFTANKPSFRLACPFLLSRTTSVPSFASIRRNCSSRFPSRHFLLLSIALGLSDRLHREASSIST